MSPNTLMTIQTVLRGIIALALTRVILRRPEMRNLRWLAVVFYGNALTGLFQMTAIGQAAFIIIQASLAMFVHETFYKDRPSPVLVFVYASIFGLLPGVIALLAGEQMPSMSPASPVVLNWLWHAVAGYQAYKAIADNRFVEDWVKGRYLMMVGYSLVIALPLIITSFLPRSAPSWTGLIFPTCLIISIILQYLVWGMPEALRRWLNRNYQSPVPETEAAMTEEEIMRGAKT